MLRGHAGRLTQNKIHFLNHLSAYNPLSRGCRLSTQGITSASPLEVKQMGAAKAALLVCVFGKNLLKEQEKRSFLTSSPEQQSALADAIIGALDFKQS